MKFKARYTQADYQEGATRLKRCFAWFPVRIGGFKVWLESFEILQVYIINRNIVTIDGEKITFQNGSWQDLSKRLCE